MHISLDGFEFECDIDKTKSYYESHSMCDCPACSYYHLHAGESFPKLNIFLSDFGVDISKPDDIVWFQELGGISCVVVSYTVNGKIEKYGDYEFDINDGELFLNIVFDQKYVPNEQISDYFVISVFGLMFKNEETKNLIRSDAHENFRFKMKMSSGRYKIGRKEIKRIFFEHDGDSMGLDRNNHERYEKVLLYLKKHPITAKLWYRQLLRQRLSQLKNEKNTNQWLRCFSVTVNLLRSIKNGITPYIRKLLNILQHDSTIKGRDKIRVIEKAAGRTKSQRDGLLFLICIRTHMYPEAKSFFKKYSDFELSEHDVYGDISPDISDCQRLINAKKALEREYKLCDMFSLRGQGKDIADYFKEIFEIF